MPLRVIPLDQKLGPVQFSITARGTVECEFSVWFWPDPDRTPKDKRRVVREVSTSGGLLSPRTLPVDLMELYKGGIAWLLRAYGPDLAGSYNLRLRFHQDDVVIAEFSYKGIVKQALGGHVGAARFVREG